MRHETSSHHISQCFNPPLFTNFNPTSPPSSLSTRHTQPTQASSPFPLLPSAFPYPPTAPPSQQTNASPLSFNHVSPPSNNASNQPHTHMNSSSSSATSPNDNSPKLMPTLKPLHQVSLLHSFTSACSAKYPVSGGKTSYPSPKTCACSTCS